MSRDWTGRAVILVLAGASAWLWWSADDFAAAIGLGDFPVMARVLAVFAFLSAAERVLARILPH